MPSCDEPSGPLAAEHRRALVQIAVDAIGHGLRKGLPPRIDPGAFDPPLRAHRASFVTLKLADQLRGCIGTLEAARPLAVDVSENAFAAAFRDPRFAPVSVDEAPRLHLSISVLGAPQPMSFADEADLLSQLRPGQDGLIIRDGARRGTFLPAVWEQLPRPEDFWRRLKLKAGLNEDHFSPKLQVWRYRVEAIE